MATNARYKLYDGTNWVEYHFTTNAGQVSTTTGRKFVTTSITINNNAAGTTGAKVTLGSDDAANIEIDGGHIAWYTGTLPTTNYLSNATSIQSALQALDTAAKNAADAVPNNVVTYDSNGDVDIGSGDLSATVLTATGSVGTPTINMGTAGSIHTDNTVDLVIETDNGGDIILSPDTGKSVKWDNKVLATLNDIPSVGTAAAKDYTTSVTQNSNDLVTSGAVWAAIDNLPEPMVFKGTIGTNGTIEWSALPSAASSNEGFTYKVITAHATTPICAVGDVIVSNGTEWVVIPAGDDTTSDTWRAIYVNGDLLKGNGISTGYVNFASGSHVTVTGYLTDITLGVESGYSIPSDTDQSAWSAKYDKPSGGIPDSDLATSYLPLSAGSSKKLTGTLYVGSQSVGDLGLANPSIFADYLTLRSTNALELSSLNNSLTLHGGSNDYHTSGVKIKVPQLESGESASALECNWQIPRMSGLLVSTNTFASREWVNSQNFAKVVSSSTQPSSPTTGMIWIDTSN